MTPEEVGNVPIVMSAGGAPVRLKDVATVTYGPQAKVGDSLVMGKPGILMTMSSQYGANTMEATLAVEAALASRRNCTNSTTSGGRNSR